MRISKPLTLGQHFQLLAKPNGWTRTSHQRRPRNLTTSNLCHSDLKMDGSRAAYKNLYCAMDANHSEADAPRFVVDGISYRRLLQALALRRAFSEPAAENFHTTAFKEYWKPSKDEPEAQISRYSDTFTSDVFNDEYEALRTTLREGPNATLEPFIAGIIFYSDVTHFTSFGAASLYPMCMYVGNQSQYTRAKPSEFTVHHIAYIPKVFQNLVVCSSSNRA